MFDVLSTTTHFKGKRQHGKSTSKFKRKRADITRTHTRRQTTMRKTNYL